MSGSLPALRALARGIRSALVGYSGGVDSALLAVVLRQELGRERVVAAVGRSPSYPAAQWATARAVAERFDVPLVELDTYELETYLHYKVLKSHHPAAEVGVSKTYPPKTGRGKYSHIRPIIDWWKILRPLPLIVLGIKK